MDSSLLDRLKALSPKIGLKDLPHQVGQNSLRKGFSFTIMVVGESGLGKSTLINSIFSNESGLYYPIHYGSAQFEKTRDIVSIDVSTMKIKEGGVTVNLTVVDTPGFGDAIDNSNHNSCQPIAEYINEQLRKFYVAETSVSRRNLIDTRIHACLYFISPFGHGLKQLDIEVMRALQNRVNLIPLIAKSDALTRTELQNIKHNVMKDIQVNKIRVYTSPFLYFTEAGEESIRPVRISDLYPLAVCGASVTLSCERRERKGRLYPWGFLDVENEEHCELTVLRRLLILHMQDLQEETHDVIYENYRLNHIHGKGEQVPGEASRDTEFF